MEVKQNGTRGQKKVWLITGAGRGMGLDFAREVVAAGHAVVATGRDPERVARAVGASNHVLAVKLDVSSRADAEAAVQAAVTRFGRIDVLVNNAASFYAGYRGAVHRTHRPRGRRPEGVREGPDAARGVDRFPTANHPIKTPIGARRTQESLRHRKSQ